MALVHTEINHGSQTSVKLVRCHLEDKSRMALRYSAHR
jgi:hypothetical protein